MMVGIVVSNSILIVEFANRLRLDGMPVYDAVVTACRVRLRPVMMSSVATLVGLLPMALNLGTGSVPEALDWDLWLGAALVMRVWCG